jgi:hypothetical protein
MEHLLLDMEHLLPLLLCTNRKLLRHRPVLSCLAPPPSTFCSSRRQLKT